MKPRSEVTVVANFIIMTISLICLGLSIGLLIVGLADWWHQNGGRK